MTGLKQQGPVLECAGRGLNLSRPCVMGVLNVTPDSFSDGGQYISPDAAVEQAGRMQEMGAAIIDVGGESTRPGASPVSVSEEVRRVIPVISALHAQLDIPISCDTRKAEVMAQAVAAGAGLINDVSALTGEGSMVAASNLDVPVCLMHMQGIPESMQQGPSYGNVVHEVVSYLASRAEAAIAAGIRAEQILLDPGIGFGKTLEHNLALLKNLPSLVSRGYPVLVGVSRKSMFGTLLGLEVDQRLPASLAAAVMSVGLGASIIRAHDVKETVDAIKVATAIDNQPVF